MALLPRLGNPSFALSLDSSVFFTGGTLIIFNTYTPLLMVTQCTLEWKLQRNTKFHLLNLFGFYKSSIGQLLTVHADKDPASQLSPHEHIWYCTPLSCKLIPTIYLQLNISNSPSSHTKVPKWEKDLKYKKNMEDWSQIWSTIGCCSINILTFKSAF